MDKQLIPFDYQGHAVRTVTLNGDPWFVAKDICEILEIVNTTDAVSRLDDDEVTRFNLGGLSGETNIVSESGLYSLTLGSKKPEAKPFKHWVTHEILPTIRKTGTYTAKPMSQAEIIAAQANLLVEVERKSNAALESADLANKRLDNALNAFAKPDEPNWRETTDSRIKRLCVENGLSYLQVFGDIYREAEHLTGRDIKAKQRNKRARMKAAGATKVQRDAVSELCIVAENKDLKIAVESIVRKLEAKYATVKIPDA